MRGRIAAALVCALISMCAADARDKPDRTDTPDIVQGDWIQPADILFVGDSESLGYFGAQLYRSLAALPDPRTGRPLKVWSFWICGADVSSWSKGGVSYCGIRTCNGAGDCARDHGPLDRPGRVRYSALREYIARIHPRVTILSLGSNMLTTREHSFRAYYDTYLQGVRHLAGEIAQGGSACIWIGPPQTSQKTKPIEQYVQFSRDLGRAARAASCAYIDSDPLSDRAFVLRGDPEGIHYQGAGERAWETKVWAQMKPLLGPLLAR